MKRLILYHNDADGKCAAAIAARWMNDGFKQMQVQCEPATYGEEPPWKMLEALEPPDPIWIVDFSYPYAVMIRLFENYGDRLYWFDHHKTALERIAPLGRDLKIEGIRSTEMAACALVWKYCATRGNGFRVPLAVTYIADRDLWKFEHGDKTRWFYEKYLQEESTHPLARIWDTYFEMTEWQYESYLFFGAELYKSRRSMLQGIARRVGYECQMASNPACHVFTEGEIPPALSSSPQYKILKINFPASGDMGQVVREMGYDIAWLYHEEYRNGKIVRVNSLYSDKVDVGVIAQGHGGGGHKGAAGFVEVV